MIERARFFRPGSVLLLLGLVTLLAFGTTAAFATPLVVMPGAPLLPAILPPTGTIFDLTPVAGGFQTGSVIPAFGFAPGPDLPVTGGICASFVTGETCPTLEPDAGVGIRDWEVEIANETGPPVESFTAGFFAPGLAAIYRVVMPLGSGIFFDFRYLGPTLPFFGVFSGVPFPVTIASSIIDPLPSQLTDITFGVQGGSFVPTTDPPAFGDSGGVPETSTLGLMGGGFLAMLLFSAKRLARAV